MSRQVASHLPFPNQVPINSYTTHPFTCRTPPPPCCPHHTHCHPFLTLPYLSAHTQLVFSTLPRPYHATPTLVPATHARTNEGESDYDWHITSTIFLVTDITSAYLSQCWQVDEAKRPGAFVLSKVFPGALSVASFLPSSASS